MQIRIPKATTVERLANTPAAAELLYDDTLNLVFYGDGVTVGGLEFVSGSPGISAYSIVLGGPGIAVSESPANTFTVSVSGAYAFVSTVESISAGLQFQIDNIDVTTISSSAGSISVSQVGSNYNLEVAVAPIGIHNDLTGIQGGTTSEYYHLTASQHANYIGETEVAAISAGLDNRLDVLEANEIPDIFRTEVASISSGLDTRLDVLEANEIPDIFRTEVASISAGIDTRLDTIESASYVNTVNSKTGALVLQAGPGIGIYSIDGTTIGISGSSSGGGITGTLTSGRVPFANGVSSLTDSARMTYDATTGLAVGFGDSTNTAVGVNAGFSITTGSDNTAFGSSALGGNTEGYDNTAVGTLALRACTIGWENTAVGNLALRFTTTGYSNTAVGFKALERNTTGYSNTAVGKQTLFNNTSGLQNIAMGENALLQNTTGNSNVAIGFMALDAVVVGGSNIAIGVNALGAATTSNNTAIGTGAGRYMTTGESNIFIGFSAGDSTAISGSNRLVAGDTVAPISNVFIGNGETAAAPQNIKYNATGGNGTNRTGASLTIAGGRNTGSGSGGPVIIQTSPAGSSGTTPGSLLDRVSVLDDGGILWNGIATAAEPALATSNNGAIFFDSTLNKFRVSQNGGAYADLVGGAGGVHNDLSGIQGGTALEYYHLTAAQHADYISSTEVAAISAGLNDLLIQGSGSDGVIDCGRRIDGVVELIDGGRRV